MIFFFLTAPQRQIEASGRKERYHSLLSVAFLGESCDVPRLVFWSVNQAGGICLLCYFAFASELLKGVLIIFLGLFVSWVPGSWSWSLPVFPPGINVRLNMHLQWRLVNRSWPPHTLCANKHRQKGGIKEKLQLSFWPCHNTQEGISRAVALSAQSSPNLFSLLLRQFS